MSQNSFPYHPKPDALARHLTLRAGVLSLSFEANDGLTFKPPRPLDTGWWTVKRGALIGCGFFAQNHLNAWRMIEGVEIVAVCDTDEPRVRNYAHTFGIAKAYNDATTMLETEALDFVDIVTQAHTHLALTTLAAKHGVNIICQKPLAPSFDEARQIVEQTKKQTFMVQILAIDDYS